MSAEGRTSAHAFEQLVISNTRSGSLTLIDLSNLTVDREVPLLSGGMHIDDIVLSPDGARFYLSIITNEVDPPNPGTLTCPGKIMAVDAHSYETLWAHDVAGVPHHLTLSTDGCELFVPIFNSNFVEVVDVETQRSVRRIPVGFGPHGSSLSGDGTTVYVGTMFSGMFTAIDAVCHQVTASVELGAGVRPFVVDDERRIAYLQTSGLHGIVEVDLDAGSISRSVDLPDPPDLSKVGFPFSVNHGLALHRDRNLIFAAATLSDKVYVLDATTLDVVSAIDTGSQPAWIILNGDQSKCIVTNRGDDTVSIIDVDELVESARLSTGTFPQRMVARRFDASRELRRTEVP